MPAHNRARKRSKTPDLVRLRYGKPYCELCKEPILVGQLVAWWPIQDMPGGPTRITAYDKTCHYACVRAGRPLRSRRTR